MTGNTKQNKKFEIESSGSDSGPKVDESSVMVSGIVPISIEFEGRPIWISKDVNSKRAFRPARIKFEVSFVSIQQYPDVSFCNEKLLFYILPILS